MGKKLNKKIIVLIVFALIIPLSAIAMFNMQVKNISIEGNEQYTDEEIKEYILGNSYDKNIAVLWIKTKLGKTKSIPFVEKYDIEIESMNKVKITIYEKSIVGYIDYMGTCMYFDKDGMVVESSDKKIEGIPKITGVDIDYILLHEPLPVENEKVFDLILTVTQTLKKYSLEVKKIYISDNLEIAVYIDEVKVNLGKEKNLSEKISDLNVIAPKLKGRSGTLDMTTLNTEGNGYTLKQDAK